MTPTVGIFFDRASAERAVGNLRAVGLSPKSMHVLVPGAEPLFASVPTSEAEQPGMGRAIGGVLGGMLLAAAWIARERAIHRRRRRARGEERKE